MELEHLKIKTTLIDEMFASVMGEYVFLNLLHIHVVVYFIIHTFRDVSLCAFCAFTTEHIFWLETVRQFRLENQS